MLGIEVAAIAMLASMAIKARFDKAANCVPISVREMETKGVPPEINNAVPAALRERAAGLGIVAGRAACLGIGRVTSMWRSPALNAFIRAKNAADGVNQEFAPSNPVPGTGDHDQAKGFDFAPPTPIRARFDLKKPADLAAAHEELSRIRDALLASDVGPFIEGALVEDDHVHCRCNAAMLEALAKSFGEKAGTT